MFEMDFKGITNSTFAEVLLHKELAGSSGSLLLIHGFGFGLSESKAS